MKFVIDEIEVQMCITYVTGRTAVGTIKGVWHNAQAPLIGQRYHVELDIYAPADAGISGLERSKGDALQCILTVRMYSFTESVKILTRQYIMCVLIWTGLR